MKARPLTAMVLTVIGTVGLAETPKKIDPQEQAIRRLIRQLDADTFEQRELAHRALLKLGQTALKPLQQVARDRRAPPEQRSRAAHIVDRVIHQLIYKGFRELAALPDEKVDLEHGMWLISLTTNPHVRRSDISKTFERLAEQVRKKLAPKKPEEAAPSEMVEALRQVVFVEFGLRGNTEDYRNPHNSSLEKVLETRKGLPILVSHVLVAVAKRVPAPIVGLPTPGRYTAMYDGAQAPEGFPKDNLYIDPFGDGKVLTLEELDDLISGLDPKRHLQPSSQKLVLVRMMNNLETHLEWRGEFRKSENVGKYRRLLESKHSSMPLH